MKPKQIVLLFLALLLPVCVFLFLKGFGKNEFNVPALFAEELPPVASKCNVRTTLPYHIPDSTLRLLDLTTDTLALVYFKKDNGSQKLSRVREAYEKFPLKILTLDPGAQAKEMTCIYFLEEPFDAVLVDRRGRLRGQYNISDRDEMDRLLTELAIIFRKY